MVSSYLCSDRCSGDTILMTFHKRTHVFDSELRKVQAVFIVFRRMSWTACVFICTFPEFLQMLFQKSKSGVAKGTHVFDSAVMRVSKRMSLDNVFY